MARKNIGFNKGIVRSPSSGDDGEMTVLHGLKVEKGELVNLASLPDTAVMELGGSERLMFVHSVQNRNTTQENYVGYVPTVVESVTRYTLQYTNKDDITDGAEIHSFTDDIVKEVRSIGNTLAIVTSDGVYYAVWKYRDTTSSMGYVWLGKDLPDVQLRFGLKGSWVKQVSAEVLTSSEVDNTTDSDSSEESYTNVVADSDELQVDDESPESTFSFNGSTTKDLRPSTNYRVVISETNNNYTFFELAVYHGTDVIAYYPLATLGDGDKYEKVFSTPLSTTDVPISFKVNVRMGGGTLKLRLLSGAEVTSNISFDNDNDTAFNQVMGCANKFINTAKKDNKFVYPFFVRYALKLYDGTFVKPSAVTLMTPNVGVAPLVWMKANGGNDPTYDLTAEGFCAELVASKIAGDLSGWEDIVMGVSIAVSLPIYSYNQGETWDIHKPKIFLYGPIKNAFNQNIGLKFSGSCYGYGTYFNDYSYERTFDNILSNNGSLATTNFLQVRIPSFTDDEIYKQATENNLLYVVKDLTPDELDAMATPGQYGSMSEAFSSLDIREGTLSTLESRQVLADNYNSLSLFTGGMVSVYNSRLVLGNVSETKFSGYAPDSFNMYLDGSEGGYVWRPLLSVVTIVENGEVRKVARLKDINNYNHLRWLYYPSRNAKHICVYSFYVEHELDTIRFAKTEVDLKRHDFMGGAYWFNGFRGVTPTRLGSYDDGQGSNVWRWGFTSDATNDDEEYLKAIFPDEYQGTYQQVIGQIQYSEEPAKFDYPNRVVQSEVYNPFVFPAELSSELGSGEIVGMAAATDALSEGQFGTFPMYLFTSEGVWALSVGSDGKFSSPQVVCRDVCINPDSIVQLDKSVVFATDKGVMLLEGRQPKLLSGALDGRDNVHGFYSNFNKIDDVLGAMNQYSFTRLLREKNSDGDFCCKFLYDYQHQLLRIIYTDESADDMSVQWVYDLVNNTWSTDDAPAVVSVINGYPHSYVQVYKPANEADGTAACTQIYQYTDNKQDGRKWGYLLTRPLCFEEPLVMKKIIDLRTVYWEEDWQEYDERHRVEVLLLGSNDRVNWSVVGSLSQQGFKWWRFAIAVYQNDWETLTGVCVDEEEVRKNKMR